MQGQLRWSMAPALEGGDWLQGVFLSRNFWLHPTSADDCSNGLVTPDPGGSENQPRHHSP